MDASDANTEEDNSTFITNEANRPDKASVQLYVINPNQQESVIADFGSEKVLWKFIGRELGPGNSIYNDKNNEKYLIITYNVCHIRTIILYYPNY